MDFDIEFQAQARLAEQVRDWTGKHPYDLMNNKQSVMGVIADRFLVFTGVVVIGFVLVAYLFAGELDRFWFGVITFTACALMLLGCALITFVTARRFARWQKSWVLTQEACEKAWEG